MVRQWQDLFYTGRYAGTDKSLHKKDFIKAAEADGFPFAKRANAVKDVRPLLEEFCRASGPAFLEVMTDTHGHVYPMVGPGMGYKDMITGKWISGREKEDDKGSGGGTPTGYF
jgi:acetolactate synthase-1/2/3 large subunit